MRQNTISSCLLFCAVFLLSGSSDLAAQTRSSSVQTPGTAQREMSAPELNDDYVIGVDDILSIYVWKEPDFSTREIVVRSDGKISIPLVNDIQAGGFTPKQLQESITEKLKEFIATPNVTVTVLKSLSRSVSVVGQVTRPGIYPMGSPITVLELLARSGGITEYAKAKSIKVVRKENGKTVQFSFNYKDAIKGKNLHQNITLKIGDVVLVP